MIVATLLSDVLPDKVAAAEMYTDPPDLAPLPEEEPLIAQVGRQAPQRVHHRPVLRATGTRGTRVCRRCRS